MGSKGRLLIDLNEPPIEIEDDNCGLVCLEPHRVIPSTTTPTTNLFVSAAATEGIVNNHAFSHASSVSSFQPFVRPNVILGPESVAEKTTSEDVSPSKVGNNTQDMNGNVHAQATEKEEGEWSDVEGSGGADRTSGIVCEESKGTDEVMESNVPTGGTVKNEIGSHELVESSDDKKGDLSNPVIAPKQREVRGIEANHIPKSTKNLGKRPKLDQQKEAMLGKKRNRQTMYLDLEDVKQVGALKSSTPRRQIPAPRTVKEACLNQPSTERGDKQTHPVVRDTKQADLLSNEGNIYPELNECKSESIGDNSTRSSGNFRRFNSLADVSSEGQATPVPRQGLWKAPSDTSLIKNSQFSGRRPLVINQSSSDPKLALKKLPSKKPTGSNNQYQDVSVERFLREVTNEKFWHHPEEEELQRVPGCFDSVQEYIKVFEPLLFEECRAQLYSTWEESCEIASSHVRVCIKSIERRERGWFDVILTQPVHEHKWIFKDGDVAVLSSPKPGSVSTRRNISSAVDDEENPEVSGRVAGTVRRHKPIDTRENVGATFHFYVGDLYDSTSSIDDDHILRKLQPRSVWYLTVLGTLATAQREYVALHAFNRLNLQMQNAILQPNPDQFPKYESKPPAMPDCFTPNFVDHLHRSFNGPQLAAIQWAAMHTAAGKSNTVSKKQGPWPFTLVQGPPGTGKTHTVWGMLNVIHLVQYQHYYTALLKKLAPESYKQNNNNESYNGSAVGSIDEVLHTMDQDLFRTLPKLCPKPRMLVCAPSNAATDELLARVLDRGFIDGEMRVYRPDIARVGVDSQNRAANAVSVERRTEQLLTKTKDEVRMWIHNLRNSENQLALEISRLQKELSAAAVTGQLQGSVGVDPDVLMDRDRNRDAHLQNLAAVVEKRDKILVDMSRLLIVEGKFRGGYNFNLEEARAQLEASFANEAEIVFTTVSSSGRKLFSRLAHGFDMVVIDEAAQASEVGVLPPLSLGAARCVLVGDPQQLPATVISKAAGTLLYSRSLFERFQQAGCPTMLLSVQYRMHPHIRDFPSRYFYQGRLTDSESVVGLPDEVYYKDRLLKPYVFYDVSYGRESHRGGSVSYQNTQEALLCLRLYEHLQKTLKSMGVGRVSVGIITPYKLQLKCLQHEFKEVMSSEEGKDIYINTVDAFQGQERDVIIMSCVRASSRGVGFVADIQRMNVAITRARRALWVMGNANALVQTEDWAALIADAKARNCYLDMESLPRDFVPKSTYGTVSSSSKMSNGRGFKSGHRYRTRDSHMESRSGTPSEDEEKSNGTMIPRNANVNFRGLRRENSVNGFSDNRSKDSWQHGIAKRQNY